MRVDILTLFPEMFPQVLGASILKRACAKQRVQIRVHNLRDWSRDKHRRVDDRPYGGGPGMVIKPEPFFDAVEEITRQGTSDKRQVKKSKTRLTSQVSRLRGKPHVVLLSPQGTQLTQRKAGQLAKQRWLILLCGHYEGVDERVRRGLVQEEISIGDYVLTCGELPAMVLIDSLVRLVPGVLGHRRSSVEESFCGNLLEYPQYTRPVEYRGMRVPQILVSGNLTRVSKWRKLQALQRTASKRPDLIRHNEG
jgi:tRNA (guanine37-N1)-methyltransferase